MDLEAFTSEQRRLATQAQFVAEGLQLAIAERAEYAGGVHWKTVKGTEYLNRFWTEPDGRKTARSLGPRSRETEQKHTAFFAGRDRTKLELQQQQSLNEDVGRMGKALRMGRLQSDAVDLLQTLNNAGLTAREGPLGVAGAPALACLETSCEHFAPIALHREDRTIRLLHLDDGGTFDVARRVADALSAKGAVGVAEGEVHGMWAVDSSGEPPVEVWGLSAVTDRMFDAGVGDAAAALRFLVRGGFDWGVAFGRNSSVVPMQFVGETTYILANPFMTAGDPFEVELAVERSLAAEELARASFRPLDRLGEYPEEVREAASAMVGVGHRPGM